MGWSGPYVGKNPSSDVVNSFADQQLESPEFTIFDRSGWIGNHRYYLCELNHGVERDNPTRMFVTVLLKEMRQGYLMFKGMDDSVGPFYYDCPIRLMNGVEQYPPRNELSANWRERVREYHQNMKESKALLKDLRRTFTKGDMRLAFTNGEQGRYVLTETSRGKLLDACYIAGYTQLFRLRPDFIDLEATKKLRATKPGSKVKGRKTA